MISWSQGLGLKTHPLGYGRCASPVCKLQVVFWPAHGKAESEALISLEFYLPVVSRDYIDRVILGLSREQGNIISVKSLCNMFPYALPTPS